MNDILEIINDLKEIREAVKNNKSFFIEIDRKIDKYQKRVDEFENANKPEDNPDLTWGGTSGYSL